MIPSIWETIYASIIALYCCWLSHLPADLYNFLMFSRNICSYRALLFNDWWIPMATICCFSCSEKMYPFEYDILMFKWLNIKNSINKFSWFSWFVTYWWRGSSSASLKIKVILYRWRYFLTFNISCGILLKLCWIKS